MASITEFSGGRWRAQVYKGGIRKSKVCPTRRLAEAWAEHVEGLLTKSPDMDGADVRTLLPGLPRRVMEAAAAIPHDHRQILDASVPIPAAGGIYFLIRADEVVYVGQSVDMLHRIARHKREGKRFDRYACIECPKEDMDRLECLYISAFVPYDNMSLGNLSADESVIGFYG